MALCVLMVGAWLAAPSVIKSQIESQGSEALGRKVSVGAVEFKPWTLELALSNVRIASADGASDQVAIERIYADAELQSALRLAPVIDAITIDAPQVRIAHGGDGKFDFDDVLQRLAARPAKPDSAPVRFALYNVVVNNGQIDFADQVGKQQRMHTVRKLHLAVPFLSNLESKRDITVQPHLAFELNGTDFDSAGVATPFAKTRKGDVSLKIDKLDLAPYLPYLPADLPVTLKGAVLDTDLRIAFEQAPAQPKVSISGTAKVSELRLSERGGAALASVASITAVLKDVRPLEQLLLLDSVEVNRLKLQASRDASGKINLDLGSKKAVTAGAAPQAAKASAAKAPAAASSDAKAADTNAAPPGWRVELDRFKFNDGEVLWSDQSAVRPVRLRVGNVDASAKDLRWPATMVTGADQKPLPPLQFEGAAFLEALAADKSDKKATAKAAQIRFKGEHNGKSGKAEVKLGDLALGLFAPYVSPYLVPRADGVLSADTKASWGEGGIKLAVQRVLLEKFALTLDQPAAPAVAPAALATTPSDAAVSSATPASTTPAPRGINPRELPTFESLEITDSTVDLNARTVNIGKLALRKPSARVVREEDASWMFAKWFKQPVAGATTPSGNAADAAKLPSQTPKATADKPAAPWTVSLADATIEDGIVSLVDRVPAKRVFIELSALKAQVKGVTLDGKKPAPVSLSAKVRSGRSDPGTISFNGTAMWAPVVAQGQLDAKQLPLHVAAPYFVDRFNIELLRADANFKGQVRYAASDAGPTVQVKGDASLDEMRANSVLAVQKGSTGAATTEELLNWKSLAAPGIDLAIVPGEPLRLKVRELALSDFFARLIINAEGRLVLQDLVKPQDTGPPAAAAPGAVPPATAATAATAKALAPVIDMGPITIINGRVAFSDRFIKPNYSADLSALNGTLGRFTSQTADGVVQMADIDLKGRAEGTAGLEVVGKVNPLAKPLALDVRGKVRDLELSPLSSYAIKYAGYGIERGKLSVEVNYTIKPDGQLTATNNIVLSQLTFGDKVEGGASLPVKLAVALLSDSKGVIDLNLPISGSINDPAFRIWPIVWKIVGNIFTKALTSPFSLFSGGGGGEEQDLATVAFTPGTAVMSPDAIAGLDKALKLLIDKPKLKTTVVGTASLEIERDAIKLDRLNNLMLAEKRRVTGAAGKDVAAVNSITDAEYPALMKEVYRRSDYKKPRNLIGLTKDVPVADMKAFMLENLRVSDDSVRELARARGIAVREYLTARQLPSERIFLGAEDVSPTAATWKPQAELSVVAD